MRLTPVMTAIRATPISSEEKAGNHAFRIFAPAIASTGTTSTQKYQYSQPITNPAPSPSPARANSVNDRTWGKRGRHLAEHAHDEQDEQAADRVAQEARGPAGDDRGAAAHEQTGTDDPADRDHREVAPFEGLAELVLAADRRCRVLVRHGSIASSFGSRAYSAWNSPGYREFDRVRAAAILRASGQRGKGAEMSFSGKGVLVTGSTSGIGEACARIFAESGARVVVTGRDRERGRGVAESIAAAGGSAQFIAADLRADGACARLIEETLGCLGRLDVLVNNAGILYTADALATTGAQWLDTFAVNVNALFYLSRGMSRTVRAKARCCRSPAAWHSITRPTTSGSIRSARARFTRAWSMRSSHCGAATPRRTRASWRPGFPCGVSRSRSRSHAACSSSPRTMRATGASLNVDGGNDATGGPYP